MSGTTDEDDVAAWIWLYIKMEVTKRIEADPEEQLEFQFETDELKDYVEGQIREELPTKPEDADEYEAEYDNVLEPYWEAVERILADNDFEVIDGDIMGTLTLRISESESDYEPEEGEGSDADTDDHDSVYDELHEQFMDNGGDLQPEIRDCESGDEQSEEGFDGDRIVRTKTNGKWVYDVKTYPRSQSD